MMKNQLAGLMKQAQAMQDNMKKMQDQLATIEVEGVSGAGLVKVTMTCKNDVKRVTIDPSLLAEDKNIQVTCAAAEPVWVEGDQARLKQVVVNLLDNAIKYTLQGGAVALSVSALDSKAVLEVADNGIGIPAEALPRVFDRFFRFDKARSRELGGAGLGLSIVKSICTAHGAEVRAASIPNVGSRFSVTLPAAKS